MKTQNIKSSLKAVITGSLFFGLIAITSASRADTYNQYQKFEMAMAKFVAACPQYSCNNEARAVKVFSRAEGLAMDKSIFDVLTNSAHQQAQIWGDTILEGDYYAAGQTRLDTVLALYQNNTLVGYRITYSEKAWETSNCIFSETNKASLKNCLEGRINEASFVSPDLSIAITDQNQFAEFKAND